MLDQIALWIGAVCAIALVAVLLAEHWVGRLGVWPSPPAGSAASLAFWMLFRGLNGAVLFLALARLGSAALDGTLRDWQVVVAIAAAALFCLYLYTLWALGRDATYCAASGLNTRGVYDWSRNPQYASAMLAYGTLAVACASPDVAALSGALIGVYALMAVVEEPWLEQAYGAAYRDFAQRVPRFFPVRKVAGVVTAQLSAPSYSAASRARKPPD